MTTESTEPTNPLAELNLEQKAGLLSGRDFWSTKAVEEAGIPSIVLTDGPHGVRLQRGAADHLGLSASIPATCFPPAVAVGSSWDPEVAARLAEAVGREARALGVAVLLGPGVNIKRSPLCGRNFEYYSEDPLLAGTLAAAHVTALQAQGVGASVKHFAANNQETDRMRISADVDERTLREIYFPAFEMVVERQPATVMCSYNKINGVHSAENGWLLTQVLRHEWGFTGAVVSDWGAVTDRVAGVAAGMDLEMPASGGTTDAEIVAAVRDGRLSEAVVDRAVRRVLALTDLAGNATEDGIDELADQHHALARELAGEAIVLLKNDGAVLPLRDGGRIAVIGAFATEPRFQGGGSSHMNPTRVDVPLDEIRALAAQRGVSVDHARGFTADGDGDSEALRVEAVQVAGNVDVAVVFAGLRDRDESEGWDRDTLELPAAQVGAIRDIAAAAAKTVVVLSHGGAVSLEVWHDDVDAIVDGSLLGQAGGGALADVLFGVVNPSGRLAESIPRRLQDNPSWMNFPGEQGHVRYGEGVLVGYRYYATADVPVRYPFGYGLSYTTVDTTDLAVETTGDDTARARVTLRNNGFRSGKHVVQVYVSSPPTPVRRPVRELRAFAKVSLEPGERTVVDLPLDRRAFAYWDSALARWTVPAGEHRIEIGADAMHVVTSATVTLAGDRIEQPLTLDSTLEEWVSHPVVGGELLDRLAATMPAEQLSESAEMARLAGSVPMRQVIAFLGDAAPREWLDELAARTVSNA
jgi:beta-glucosidase